MGQTKNKITSRIVAVYVVIFVVSTTGFGLSLYQNWQSHITHVTGSLIGRAVITNALIEGSLLDATRLLDVAKKRINSALVNDLLNDRSAHQILKESVEQFSFFNPQKLMGLLFYADKSGVIRAENGEFPMPLISVKDRVYFRELSAHPDYEWYVGEMVTGRRNHKATFHLAVPLLDEEKQFHGVLMQQILVSDIARIVDVSAIVSGAETVTLQQDGYLTYGSSAVENTHHPVFFESLRNTVLDQNKSQGWFVLAADGHAFVDAYAGFDRSPTFGLTTVVVLPTSRLISSFLSANLALLLYALGGFLLVSFLFLKFYGKSRDNELNHELSLHDALTNLPNRRAFDEIFDHLWHDAMRQKKSISALFVDIDHFKVFNDTYGHDIGDAALKLVAEAILRCTKRPLDFCCRWGGEEFLIILPETDESGAIHVSNCLLNLVSQLQVQVPNDTAVKVAVSIGIATLKVTDNTFHDDLISMADKAMLQAKQMGRGRYVVFNAGEH